VTRRALRRTIAVPVLAAVGAATLASCSTSGGGGGGYTLSAVFPRTISLYPSSDVRVLGLPAGKVTTVRVEGNNVRVQMRLKKSVPVPADVRATIVPLSLIGERYVQLFPVWTDGVPRARSGDLIPLERTDIPVEPDEALAALKKFLDTLDPQATGNLITNLAGDLGGNGQRLNDALGGTSNLVATLADKDEQLVHLIDHFDRFTQTLRTRESELGRTMELFATTTDLLAQERRTIESLVANLSSVSTNAFDLVSEHRVRLDRDLTILTRLLQSVRANVDSVEKVLDSAPILVNGIKGAYSKQYHRLDLRTQISPTVAQLIGVLPGNPAVGPCLPIDVSCVVTAPGSTAAQRAEAAAAARPAAPPAATAGPSVTAAGVVEPVAVASAVSPIDALVDLLGTGTRSVATPAAARQSSAVRVGHAAGGVGSFLRRVVRAALGVAR
jgi:phospholipid/cholesterol/gamma-HCH transport system substrate-binding protein